MASSAQWWIPLIAPHRLAEVAIQARPAALFIVGSGAIALGLGLFVSAKATCAGEPFYDLGDYLWDYCRLAAVLAAFAYGPLLILASGLGLVATMPTWSLRARALALWPVTILLPWSAWCTAVALAAGAPGPCEFVRGKPAWMQSSIVTFAASPLWGAGILAAGGVLYYIALRRLSVLVRRPGHCPCGYSLEGTRTGDGCATCPECGAAWRLRAAD